MICMLVPALIETEDSIWVRQTLDGLMKEAARRKYRFIQLDGNAYTTLDYAALFGQERRLVIIAGASKAWMAQALRFFAEQGIDTVIINFDPQEPMMPQGEVRMDYDNAMHTLLTYFSECGRRNIACFGFNPNSSADMFKKRYFEWWSRLPGNDGHAQVFLNFGSLEACYAQFRAAEGFDAAICANDIVAVFLTRRLRDSGISVPEQMYVAAFGNLLLAQRVRPAITTASLDYYEMGRQAVILYAHLCRQRAAVSMSVRVHSRLMIRESTALTPMREGGMEHPIYDGGEAMNVDFYSDEDIRRLLLAEQMFHACDAVDEALLRGFLRGDTYERQQEALYLTADALKYRKKRLMHWAKCETNAQFRAFLLFCREVGLFG